MLIKETREGEERPIKGGRMIFEHSKDETPCFTFETANRLKEKAKGTGA